MALEGFTTVTEIERTPPDPNDRYNYDVRLFDGTYNYFPSYKKLSVPENESDLYHEVTAGEAGKLDSISWKYYNTPYLWWVIALANNVLNPLRVEAGTLLRIPAIETIFRELL